MEAVLIPSSILDVSRAAFPRGRSRALYNTAPHRAARIREDCMALSKSAAKLSAEKLRKQIRGHEYLYYVSDAPKISDAEFDRADGTAEKDSKRKIPNWRLPDSPSQRVGGAPRDGFQTVRHARPMMSLDNAFSVEAVTEFDRRVHELSGREKIDYTVEHKFDGLSIALLYENGALVRGVTRGDGTTGEDVTPNVRTIRSVPLSVDLAVLRKLGMSADFEVRGEIIMPKKAFEALNREQEKEGGKIFVNARNTAAGAVRVLDPQITAKRRLDFYAYYLFAKPAASGGKPIKRHSQTLEALTKLGFKVCAKWQICPTLDCVLKYCEAWDTKREKLPYEIDGIVIKVDEFCDAGRIGIYGESAAMGDCVQMARAAGNHRRQRHYCAGWTHRRADSCCDFGAGASWRSDGEPFNAAQHG